MTRPDFMDDDTKITLAVALVFVVGCISGWVLGNLNQTSKAKLIQTEAVQLGYAYHEPTNGNWMWKTNN